MLSKAPPLESPALSWVTNHLELVQFRLIIITLPLLIIISSEIHEQMSYDAFGLSMVSLVYLYDLVNFTLLSIASFDKMKKGLNMDPCTIGLRSK